jgi:hypothetical protein
MSLSISVKISWFLVLGLDSWGVCSGDGKASNARHETEASAAAAAAAAATAAAKEQEQWQQ